MQYESRTSPQNVTRRVRCCRRWNIVLNTIREEQEETIMVLDTTTTVAVEEGMARIAVVVLMASVAVQAWIRPKCEFSLALLFSDFLPRSQLE
jgi:hypothetical protein